MDKRRFLLSTVVWGPWHTGIFLSVNLASLLAPGNLAALARQHDVSYRIYTDDADVPVIRQSPAFRRAQQIVPMEVTGVAIDRHLDPIQMHHLLWRRSIDDALAAGAMILFVPPDVVWSNGALAHVGRLAKAGKRAIFMSYVRVIAETVVPELERRYRGGTDPVMDAPARELVDLAMRHAHPLFLTYLRNSPNFPIHPEFILWPVEGEGYLMRVLVREMFAYDPNTVHLNAQALPAHPIDPALAHYITDSDDLFALSLTPLMKDLEWYATSRRLDAWEVGSWWLRYDSPANDDVAACYFHIHGGDKTPASWRRAERQSDALLARIRGVRETLRILSVGPAAERPDIQQLLALALAETPLARLAGPRTRVSLLLPDATTVCGALLEEVTDITAAASRRRLLRTILDHALIGELRLEAGRSARLATPLGGSRRLEWRRGKPFLDGVALIGDAFVAGGYRCHRLQGLLPPSWRAGREVTADHGERLSA
ncbi:MAG TPA: hypothetical protein VNK52_12325 [Hyphomicrobiaceae bacterium]|nr:hypothetical protein [Hyphomicrobiaceae bacterium]